MKVYTFACCIHVVYEYLCVCMLLILVVCTCLSSWNVWFMCHVTCTCLMFMLYMYMLCMYLVWGYMYGYMDIVYTRVCASVCACTYVYVYVYTVPRLLICCTYESIYICMLYSCGVWVFMCVHATYSRGWYLPLQLNTCYMCTCEWDVTRVLYVYIYPHTVTRYVACVWVRCHKLHLYMLLSCQLYEYLCCMYDVWVCKFLGFYTLAWEVKLSSMP